MGKKRVVPVLRASAGAGGDAHTQRRQRLKQAVRDALDRHDQAAGGNDEPTARRAWDALVAACRNINSQTINLGPGSLIDQALMLANEIHLEALPSGENEESIDLGIYEYSSVPHVRFPTAEQLAENPDMVVEIPACEWPDFQHYPSSDRLLGGGDIDPNNDLLTAMDVLSRHDEPLFVRHLARKLIHHVVGFLFTGWPMGWIEMNLVSIGALSEQMRVARKQAAALAGKVAQKARSRGGKTRAEIKERELKDQQAALNEIMDTGCKKEKACQILSDQLGISAETLMKKLRVPKKKKN
jgi:hypothetical protein